MKFLHTADLHIDSPLRGLAAYDDAPLDRLRQATRTALENLVQLAIDEEVEFVVVAGDLFDGPWDDMSTGLWTLARFRQLREAGIRVVLLRGNHDAASRVPRSIQWPDNVHEFSVDEPETIVFDDVGVALHGQGFAQERVHEDLAARYPAAMPGFFNIGVLHTNLTGSPLHDRYAATSMDVLRGREYDYWALGHIHLRSDPPICRQPYVAYCGNTQGRHAQETGAKGCLLAHTEDGVLQRVDFRETDEVRWFRVCPTVDAHDDTEALLTKVRDGLQGCLQAAPRLFVAARIEIAGLCAAHAELAGPSRRQAFLGEVRNAAALAGDQVWLEQVLLETRPLPDLDRLRRGHDLAGELLRSVDAYLQSDERLVELVADLQPLIDRAGPELAQAGIQLDDPGQLRRWLQQAEGVLLSGLMEDES